jgi:hypothetical protein
MLLLNTDTQWTKEMAFQAFAVMDDSVAQAVEANLKAQKDHPGIGSFINPKQPSV